MRFRSLDLDLLAVFVGLMHLSQPAMSAALKVVRRGSGDFPARWHDNRAGATPRLVEGKPANVGIGRPALHKVLGDRAQASGAIVSLGVPAEAIEDDGVVYARLKGCWSRDPGTKDILSCWVTACRRRIRVWGRGRASRRGQYGLWPQPHR